MFLGKVQATLPRNRIKYVGLQYIVKGTEEAKRSHIIFTDAEWLRTDLEKSIFFRISQPSQLPQLKLRGLDFLGVRGWLCAMGVLRSPFHHIA